MVAFITGITTGGLSCLAVQGGLLASSLAHQIEQDYVEQSTQNKKHEKKTKQLQPVSASPNFLSFLARFSVRFVIYVLLIIVGVWIFGLNSPKYVMPIIIGVAAVIEALRAYLPQSRLALPICCFLLQNLLRILCLAHCLAGLVRISRSVQHIALC